MHVFKEMLELCQIVNTEGYVMVEEEPALKFIPFGELFNVSFYLKSAPFFFKLIFTRNLKIQIYTHINDKLVGLLLRARKHKLLDFEGEVLFQRRDDDVPVCMLKPIKEIKEILDAKVDEVRRSVSPNPNPTTMLIK